MEKDKAIIVGLAVVITVFVIFSGIMLCGMTPILIHIYL